MHSGLPEVDELAGNGTHRDRTQAVVDELSKRYQVIELVDGALAELDGSCPPLQDWIDVRRDELIRRREHPTIGERVWEFRPRWGTVPIVIGTMLLVLSIGALAVQYPRIRSDTVVCQIYDMATRQRILKPFTLTFGEVRRESVGTQCEMPSDAIDAVDEVVVEGYIRRAPDEIERETANGQPIVKYFVSRDADSFFNSILPDFASVRGLPSDGVVKERLRLNSVPAEDVTFLVKNETDLAVDVLLYYLPPSDHMSEEDAFLTLMMAGTQLISGIKPRGWSKPFDDFGLEAGFFAIFVSHSGRKAELLTADALYQSPWAVLYLSRADDPPKGRLEFFESDPRRERRETNV